MPRLLRKKHEHLNQSIKRLSFALFILFFPLNMMAKKSPTFTVIGVKGPVLNNVQTRLDELLQNKSLSTISDSELRVHVEKALQPYGFFQSIITISNTEKKHLISINAGPPLQITQLSIRLKGEGQDNNALLQAYHQLPLKPHTAFKSIAYEEAKQALLSTAQQEGYLHAFFEKSEILIDKENNSAHVTLILDTGSRYFFGQVRFDPTYISPKVLQRYLPFHPGDTYSAEKITTFNDYLISSGYFKQVIIQPAETVSSDIPIDVHLQAASPVHYSLGLGFGTDTGPRGRAGMYVAPINPAGHKFNAIALGSFKENALQTQYIIPGEKPLIDQYEITSNLSSLHYDAGNSNAILLSLSQRHNLPDFLRILSLNSLYERFSYTAEPRVEKFSLFPKASLGWIKKSEELFSPQGYHVTLSGLFASKALLSQTNFSQESLDFKAALMLEKLRMRLYAHGLLGFTQINDINQFPLSLALLLGGSDNLKGYEYNSLGPGKTLLYGGIEIQKETKDNWYLIAFMDTGDVYCPTPLTFKKDIGLGLMWVSPVGPIKLGVAQAVDDHFHRLLHKNPQLVISMGPDF